MTSRPFGVNIILGGPHLPLPETAFVDACIEEQVPLLSFFWGFSTPYIEKAQRAGIKVCDQVIWELNCPAACLTCAKARPII